ncbi:MAG: hypothetical protein II977_05280 [Oscillospiraceae bacterium]|nr:hypothetical protein [Oscillospiraceae bacterium]
MALFSSKPKLQTIKQFGRTFQYMEFVKGYPLPDDVDMLKNMVSFYSNHSSCYPTKSDMQKGYIRTADYHDILIKYFQLGGKLDVNQLNDMGRVSSVMAYYDTSRYYRAYADELNPDTLKNRALGKQLWKKMVERYLACPGLDYPMIKLSLACLYLAQYPDSFDHITAIMKKVAEEEMELARELDHFLPENLGTTAVLEYMEHDWPAFYEAEFGYLPQDAPETVSGILKKYNLTAAQYYEKAAKGGGGKRSMLKAVEITPACVINEMLNYSQHAINHAGDDGDVIARFNTLLTRNYGEELYKNARKDLLALSCIQHMFADIGLAAFMLDKHNFPDDLPAFGGFVNKNSKNEVTAYKTGGSLAHHKIANAGYARMMRRHGIPERVYKSEAMYGEPTFSEVYRQADRARDLKFRTKAAKAKLFEPDL